MLSLTTEERKVLIFLFGVALVGVGTSYATKVFAPVKSIARLDRDFGKIDLNSADKNLLKSVPGIGEKLAQRIVKLREEKAGFYDLEQLKDIKGITNNKFNRIKNYLVVR
jgi:competence ComEA-like helix-hairpin-helix protein